MMNALRAAGLAAAMAFAPLAVSAATITEGSYNFSEGPAFDYDESFGIGTEAGTLEFTFTNDLGVDAYVTILAGTIKQVTAMFDTDLTIDFGGMITTIFTPGTDNTLATQNFLYEDILVAAGESITLMFDHGSVVDRGVRGGFTNIDFGLEVAPVPVPAAGLLLLTALGGIAVMRRRKDA